ncbi:MAG: SH3 domain-containing protein [Chloroflexia bacterium]|nr:SH3 domain-containing protein [Chloroflexia bacterium]
MVLHTIVSRRRFVIGSAGAAVLAIAPALLAPSPAGATASEFFATAKPGLRLRSGPGLGYKILASLSMGARVERLASGGRADGYEWVKVRVVSSGKTGFVAFKFLTTAPSDGFEIGQTVHVEAGGGRGNLRSGPGTGYRVMATLSTGTTGTIKDGPVEATGYFWHKVSFGNVTGWIVTSVLAPGAGSR